MGTNSVGEAVHAGQTSPNEIQYFSRKVFCLLKAERYPCTYQVICESSVALYMFARIFSTAFIRITLNPISFQRNRNRPQGAPS